MEREGCTTLLNEGTDDWEGLACGDHMPISNSVDLGIETKDCDACRAICELVKGCDYFTYKGSLCYLNSVGECYGNLQETGESTTVTGSKTCSTPSCRHLDGNQTSYCKDRLYAVVL